MSSQRKISGFVQLGILALLLSAGAWFFALTSRLQNDQSLIHLEGEYLSHRRMENVLVGRKNGKPYTLLTLKEFPEKEFSLTASIPYDRVLHTIEEATPPIRVKLSLPIGRLQTEEKVIPAKHGVWINGTALRTNEESATSQKEKQDTAMIAGFLLGVAGIALLVLGRRK